MITRIRKWSMATKQFWFLFIAMFVLFFFLAYNNYNRAAALFKSQIIADTMTQMARTNQYLDSYLDTGQNILLLISTQTGLLKSSQERDISEFLRSIADANSTIVKTLYIVRSDGKVFSSSQVFYDVLGNEELPKLYEQAKMNYTAMVSQPYISLQSGPTVAIARPMLNNWNERVGVAVVEFDLEKLYRNMAEISLQNQTFVLLSDKNNVVLYGKDSELLPADSGYPVGLPEPFAAHLGALPVGTSGYEGPAGPLVTLKSGQNRLGWSLILIIKESFFYQNIVVLYQDYKTVGTAMLILLLIMAYVMSRFSTRPIRMLALRMDRVHDMLVVPNLTVRRQDEIGRLASSFNAMMERIRMLMVETKEVEARKKELELKVLQSQISPHFLYNTLACIGSLARQQRIGEVSATIGALVEVLTFSFDKTSEFVRVEDELNGLRQYVYIQKTRYGDRFRYIEHVTEEAKSLSILKLTLQPLVENAIFHGILPERREGCITIRGDVRRGVLRLVVRDNGTGMDAAALAKVLEDGRRMEGAKDHFTGIGLPNVHERIRLRFGKPYGLRIRSRPGTGTVIVITLPALQAAERRVD